MRSRPAGEGRRVVEVDLEVAYAGSQCNKRRPCDRFTYFRIWAPRAPAFDGTR
jgi:hypothetical protein